MLTPQEVSERAFPKASFGGYNMSQVDEFLDVLTEDYSALYSENAVLKSKMKVLVEKVEEYRSTEEAMRKALMTAQRMADDLVKEAEQKRDQILQEAAEEAQKKVDSIRQEAEAEQFRLAAAQKETASYVAKVKALHAQAQAYLDQLDQLVPAAPDQREEKVDLNDLPELTGTRKLVLLVMGATFALLIVGVLKWGWYINELSALFLGMGIVVGFVARVGFDGFGRLFSRGVADFAAGALAVGFARGILIVLEGGNILHTILYGASGLLTSLPSSLTVLGMYVFQNFLNLLIPSASGQAATSLPILLPMGDMADITRQTTCIIFQIGNGLSNILVPTSGTFMVALTMAKVPYGKWAKWFIPLLGLQFAAGAVLVLIANAIRLGPM